MYPFFIKQDKYVQNSSITDNVGCIMIILMSVTKWKPINHKQGEKNEGSTNLKILLNGRNNLEVTAKSKHKGKHSSSVILKQLKNGSLLVPVNEINNQKDGTCSNRIS